MGATSMVEVEVQQIAAMLREWVVTLTTALDSISNARRGPSREEVVFRYADVSALRELLSMDEQLAASINSVADLKAQISALSYPLQPRVAEASRVVSNVLGATDVHDVRSVYRRLPPLVPGGRAVCTVKSAAPPKVSLECLSNDTAGEGFCTSIYIVRPTSAYVVLDGNSRCVALSGVFEQPCSTTLGFAMRNARRLVLLSGWREENAVGHCLVAWPEIAHPLFPDYDPQLLLTVKELKDRVDAAFEVEKSPKKDENELQSPDGWPTSSCDDEWDDDDDDGISLERISRLYFGVSTGEAGKPMLVSRVDAVRLFDEHFGNDQRIVTDHASPKKFGEPISLSHTARLFFGLKKSYQ